MSHFHFIHSYQTLPPAFYTRITQTADFPAPQTLCFNHTLAQQLGISADAEAADIWCGNRFPDGAAPIAQAYAGHQFGHFALLGDGRALLLGEQQSPDGRLYDIQLKGSGKTPYSRRGDGKAAVAPMLREYLMSEAMHALGIATTRSLAVVRTGERVYRPRFPDGAVLVRSAQSHIRVGTFQFAAATGDIANIRALADYTLKRHFADIATNTPAQAYTEMLGQIIIRQAKLLAQWQSVGFVHGVMNTDNTSIAGETLDYGPCAFLDHYHPDTVFSSIDEHGRYRYANQPLIAEWNLARLAETLLPLLDTDESRALDNAHAQLAQFQTTFRAEYQHIMQQKLGLPPHTPHDLPAQLLQLMQNHRADYSNTFVRLSLRVGSSDAVLDGTQDLFAAPDFAEWYARWQQALQEQDLAQTTAQMRAVNPFVIPRNAHVEAALAAAETGEMQPFMDLLTALQQPFAYTDSPSVYQSIPATSEPYQTFCGT